MVLLNRRRPHSVHRSHGFIGVDNTFRHEPMYSSNLRFCHDYAQQTRRMRGVQEFESKNANRLIRRQRQADEGRPSYSTRTLFSRPRTGVDAALGTNGCASLDYGRVVRPSPEEKASSEFKPRKSDEAEKWQEIRREVEERRAEKRREEAQHVQEALVSNICINKSISSLLCMCIF